MKKFLLTALLSVFLIFLVSCNVTTEVSVYYTVSFVTNSDTVIEEQEVIKDGLVKKPTDPIKAGYDFDGWYSTSTFVANTEWNFATDKVVRDTTLYAKWKEENKDTYYTVTFNTVGGNTIKSVEVLKDGLVEKPTDPVKEGFDFDGWYSTSTYEADSKWDFETDKVAGPLTLYAKWLNKSATYYNVSFDTHGGSKIGDVKVEKDKTVSRPKDPTYEKHRFLGWYEDEKCEKEFNFNTPITEDITLHAGWIETFKVTFVDEFNTHEKVTVDKGSTIKNLPKPTALNKEFGGWYEDSSYTESKKWTDNSVVIKDTTLYAKWTDKEAEKYTVTFNSHGGTSVEQEIVEENGTVTKPADPTYEKHRFLGWFTDEECEKEFDFNTPITKDITLHAGWVRVYVITFEDEFNTHEKVTVDEGDLLTSLPHPTKDGKAFLGWYIGDTKFNINTPIDSDLTLVAKWRDLGDDETNLISDYGGYREGAYIEFDLDSSVPATGYKVSYKKTSDSTYNSVDTNLVRLGDTTGRADIIALTPGTYEIKLEAGALGEEVVTVEVSADDRSGYAHFNYTDGIGAYNDDGTLKSNAVVVYVTDATKNTVTAKIGSKTYTGLVNIIQACNNKNYALDIRVIGEIQTTQWNAQSHGEGSTSTRQNNLENLFKYTTDSSGWDEGKSTSYSRLYEDKIISKGINSMSNDLAKGITQLNGLTTFVTRTKKANSDGIYEYDSYFNMLDVSNGYNITIEGIGTDAAIFQWGFAFKMCNSIEVKNIRFYNYTEDAVGFEGKSGSESNYGHYWIHNCTFDIGVNNWDVCYEADKGDGDGSTDIKYCHNETISYCRYNHTHKTNLIGSSDSSLQYNITLHHNYYNECGSRMPLVRQSNIHIYNNYYYKSTGYCTNVRAGAFAFIENNYYDQAKNPYQVNKVPGTIKSYNNTFNSTTTSSSDNDTSSNNNTVTSRTQAITGGPTCKPDGSTDYTNFDTNSTLFYYDNDLKQSKVSLLLSPEAVVSHCKAYSGTLKGAYISDGGNQGGSTPDNPIPSAKDTFNVNNLEADKSFAIDAKIYDCDYYSLTNIEDPEATKGGSIKVFENKNTVTANDGSRLTFAKSLLPAGSGRLYSFVAKQTVSITVYFTICDSNFEKDPVINKPGELQVNGTSVTSSGDKASNVAYAYTFTITANQTYNLRSSANRLIIFAVIVN